MLDSIRCLYNGMHSTLDHNQGIAYCIFSRNAFTWSCNGNFTASLPKYDFLRFCITLRVFIDEYVRCKNYLLCDWYLYGYVSNLHQLIYGDTATAGNSPFLFFKMVTIGSISYHDGLPRGWNKLSLAITQNNIICRDALFENWRIWQHRVRVRFKLWIKVTGSRDSVFILHFIYEYKHKFTN